MFSRNFAKPEVPPESCFFWICDARIRGRSDNVKRIFVGSCCAFTGAIYAYLNVWPCGLSSSVGCHATKVRQLGRLPFVDELTTTGYYRYLRRVELPSVIPCHYGYFPKLNLLVLEVIQNEWHKPILSPFQQVSVMPSVSLDHVQKLILFAQIVMVQQISPIRGGNPTQ